MAQIASQAGQHRATYTWQLLGSLLIDIIPGHPPTPLSPKNPSLPHSASAPAAIPSIYSFPPKKDIPLLTRSGSSEPIVSKSHTSPSRLSQNNADLVNSPNSRNLTPTSSSSSSPRRLPSLRHVGEGALDDSDSSGASGAGMRETLVMRKPVFGR